MRPEDVLDADAVRFVLAKHNGFDECWLYSGDEHSRARRAAWTYENPDRPNAQRFGTVCGFDECIHPLHLYVSQSIIGRMFYILENSKRHGECVVWTGPTDKCGSPRMRGIGDRRDSWVSVRKFQYNQEHNIELMGKDDRVLVTCETELCVEPSHLEWSANTDPDAPRCPNGHKLRPKRNKCHKCGVWARSRASDDG